MANHSETLPAAGVVREAIDLRRFPWIRPLVGAYAQDFASVAPLFAGNPAEPSAWRETIVRVQRAPRDRDRLGAILAAQLERRGAPPEARAAAVSLTGPETVAVVTGQQAGLFGGPLYTLLKAITAVQLARRVRDEHGVPAVPVFWVDAEDHDWEEIRAVDVLDASFELRTIALGLLPGAGEQPVATLVLDQGIAAALDALRAALAPTEFTADVLADLGRHYRPGATVAEAFAGWIDHLLGRHGLVVFEAADPAAKPLVADLFAREIGYPCRTARLAREAGAAMAALGHAPQVEPSEDGVALFYLDPAGRKPIKRQDTDFVVGETARPGDALRDEARTHPERFSPNVLLRPLVQDRLFPTVCYVAGPSELAYQAQLKGIYQEFGVEPPLLYPRASATLVDSGAQRFLERHAVPLETLHARDESALNRWLESQLPPTIDRALEETSRQVEARATAMKEAVVTLDPTLAGAVDTTRDRMLDTLKSLHGKIIQASKRKDETLRRQFMRTQTLAFPGGHPQERTLGVVFFANRYGQALVDRLLDGLPLDTDRHFLITI